MKSVADSDFSEKLINYKKRVDESLIQHFRNRKKEFPNNNSFYDAFTSKLGEFSLRPGKRIRGSLGMAAYELNGGDSTAVANSLAVCLELTQDYLLIVDDVMDRSTIRRGGKTLHVQFSNKGIDLHAANMAAINLGLFTQHESAKVLSSIDVETSLIVAANKKFHANLKLTCIGQYKDMFNNLDNDYNESEIVHSLKLKSGYYTFVNPIQLGLAIAGSTEELVDSVVDFGLNAGIAYQLHDDFIGLFGNSKDTGKSNIDDLKEGKITLLIQNAIRSADKTQKKVLLKHLGNPNITDQEGDEVRKIVINTGSLDYVKGLINKYQDRSIRSLRETNLSREFIDFTENLVRYIFIEDLKSA